MNRVLGPAKEIAAVYLDDVLVHTNTVKKGIENLEVVLKLLRTEGLTLNLAKCSFLLKSVNYLGFEISEGIVKPGAQKTRAIDEFPIPKTVHNVRQFVGLTGYFRHFVKDYALIAKPLTRLTKKDIPWQWTEIEHNSFGKLRSSLTCRPTLALFEPKAETHVHTDASSHGLAGILLQMQPDNRLHPVAYYSRQTTDAESKYHSYELETLAVVETLKKFRVYLIGIEFTVVTDCNALKATSTKKEILPRIARWWLQLQEYTFTVQYRPGNRLKHVDALSRNPSHSETSPEDEILHITQADWVLSGQLTDEKIKHVREVLSKPPETDYERGVYKNYALRDGRVYRLTVKGLLWVVPRGMRHQVVRSAHDEMGHFAMEKTLHRLCEQYWFPRMRTYVERYISSCISCTFNKRNSGKKEGFLHSIKVTEPLGTFHVDHLGPFPKSRRGNSYLVVGIDAFTKFAFLKSTKSTKTKYVIDYFKDIFATYGTPKVLISDQGSCFTARMFKDFCKQNNIKHVLNAVATPRANGQVERLNRTILNALMTSTLEEDLWDEQVRSVQFAINNTLNKTTGKTASQLLLGYSPRGGSDSILRDEVSKIPSILEDLIEVRRSTIGKISDTQTKQKEHFDKKRKAPRIYKEGDLVVVEKSSTTPGTSNKMVSPYAGPFVVKAVLPNDRYVVQDMEGSKRTLRSAKYERVIAVDRMKPWTLPGGVSDGTASESGEDDVDLSSDTDGDQTQ